SLPAGLPTAAGTGGGTVRLYGRLGNLKAESGVLDKLRTRLTAYNDALVIRELGRRGLDPGFLKPIRVRTVDASRPQEAASGQLAFIIPLFLLQFILAGAVGPAIDSTAGEKERGTLEALLVSPARRVEVVAAKLIATTISALTAAGFGLIGLLLSAALARQLAGSGPAGGLGGQLSVSPAAFLVLGLMVLSAALLLSALLIAVCIFARSAREAQTYVAPVSLLIVLPAVGLQFADFIGRGTALYAVPLVNTMLTILDIVKGALSLPHALLALGVNLICTGLLGLLALRSFGREGVIFRS
ncbi:MAG: ABC transporter permease, partial [Deinococcus sp.]